MSQPINIKVLPDDNLTGLHKMLEQAMHPDCEDCTPPWEIEHQFNLVTIEMESRNLI